MRTVTKYRALRQENGLLPASFRDEAVIEGMLARMNSYINRLAKIMHEYITYDSSAKGANNHV